LDESVDLERKIPVMLLHTFVENAVKHAIRQNINGGRISLSIKNETDELHIAITDTGREGESRVSPEQSSGKGVSLVENIVSYHNKRNSQWKMRIHIDDSRLGRTVLVIIPNYFTFDAN
jgi:sensor histidine kinase YesM